NRALHTIVLSRQRYDQATKDYTERRTSEGKTPREIKRCLKRYIARDLYRLLENPPLPARRTLGASDGWGPGTSERRGEQHGPGMRSRRTVAQATAACRLLAVATISHRRSRRCR